MMFRLPFNSLFHCAVRSNDRVGQQCEWRTGKDKDTSGGVLCERDPVFVTAWGKACKTWQDSY